MTLPFTKMHGCGNDYVYLNAFEHNIPTPSALAVRLSDRHKSIGGDGLILVCPPRTAGDDAFMDMYNNDGSRGQMCGNGIRCVAKFLCDKGIAHKPVLSIGTPSGSKQIDPVFEDGVCTGARVNMGVPTFFETETEAICLSVGNPHAVLVVDDVQTADVETIGRAYNQNPAFPDGVNVEFCRILSRTEIDFRVWERGTGETMACGSGATAAVCALASVGKLADAATVHLPGGDLFIEWNRATNELFMTGEAVTVFEGVISSYSRCD